MDPVWYGYDMVIYNHDISRYTCSVISDDIDGMIQTAGCRKTDWYRNAAVGGRAHPWPGAVGHPPGPAGEGMVWHWAGSSLATRAQQTRCVTMCHDVSRCVTMCHELHNQTTQASHAPGSLRMFENTCDGTLCGLVLARYWMREQTSNFAVKSLCQDAPRCGKVIGCRMCIMETCPITATRELPIGMPAGPSPRRRPGKPVGELGKSGESILAFCSHKWCEASRQLLLVSGR